MSRSTFPASFSTPLGQMLAQAEFCPSQIGTIKFTVTWTLDELGLEAFEPGDVLLHDDPYRGSGHVPEHMMLKPVFYNGEIFAFVATSPTCPNRGPRRRAVSLATRRKSFRKGCCCPRQDQAPGRGRAGYLEDHPRQSPHAQGHLRRLPGDDGLARPGGSADHRSARHVWRRDRARGGEPTSSQSPSGGCKPRSG